MPAQGRRGAAELEILSRRSGAPTVTVGGRVVSGATSSGPVRRGAPGMPLAWYADGMKTTIDKAGRVVIPASVRQRFRLRPGTELEVVADDVSVRLLRKVPGPRLVRVGGRWVARPSAAPRDLPEVDVAALVEEERNRSPW